jgi:hypothetical protein
MKVLKLSIAENITNIDKACINANSTNKVAEVIIISKENNFYMLQDNQEILLQDENYIEFNNQILNIAIFENNHLNSKCIEKIDVITDDTECVELVCPVKYSINEHIPFALDAVLIGQSMHDPLAFLIKNTANAVPYFNSPSTIKKLPNPLPMLKQNFQPPLPAELSSTAKQKASSIFL